MKTFLALVSFLSFFLPFFATAQVSANEIQEGSPFTKVAIQGQYVKIANDAIDYKNLTGGRESDLYLYAIDGISIDTVIAACTAQFGTDCEKRFAENFVELLSTLAIDGTDWNQPGALEAVDLQIYIFAIHRLNVFEDVAVTPENRELVITDRLLQGL